MSHDLAHIRNIYTSIKQLGFISSLLCIVYQPSYCIDRGKRFNSRIKWVTMGHHSLLSVLLIWTMAGLQIIMAQDVADCEDIGAGLGTETSDPVIGEHQASSNIKSMIQCHVLA